MRVFGLLVVRNAVDVVRLCVLHHLCAGCERILVVDNGSSDGTTTVLRRLQTRTPLSFTVDGGPFVQDELLTGMAHEAVAAGADWLIPLDADEFWTARGHLHAALRARPGASALRADRVNFAQRRDERTAIARSVLSMTMRVRNPRPAAGAPELVRAGELSVLEVVPGPKLLLRAGADLVIHRGAHRADGLSGAIAPAPELSVLHGPLRARSILDRKADHGRRLEQIGVNAGMGWHLRHWAERDRAGALDAEWAAHSYDRRGELDVGGRRVPLVRDERLRTALLPFVRSRHAQLAARLLRRTL